MGNKAGKIWGSTELIEANGSCEFHRIDFVKGGKLPGLFGGEGNTGGGIPTGMDGFSARMMWRGSGRVVQYVYYPDQVHVPMVLLS